MGNRRYAYVNIITGYKRARRAEVELVPLTFAQHAIIRTSIISLSLVACGTGSGKRKSLKLSRILLPVFGAKHAMCSTRVAPREWRNFFSDVGLAPFFDNSCMQTVDLYGVRGGNRKVQTRNKNIHLQPKQSYCRFRDSNISKLQARRVFLV